MQDYEVIDGRISRPQAPSTVRDLRVRVDRCRKDLAEWEHEAAALPGLIAAAERAYGKHLGELRAALGVDGSYGDAYISALIWEGRVAREAAIRVQHHRDQFAAMERSDPRRSRAWLAARSTVLPREVNLARQALFSAEHDLAGLLADLEER